VLQPDEDRVDWAKAEDWRNHGAHSVKHGTIMPDRSAVRMSHRGRRVDVIVEPGQVRIRSWLPDGHRAETVLPVPLAAPAKKVTNGR
jgi:hypothetical protein